MTTTTKNLQTESTTLDQLFTCLSHPTRRRILATLATNNPHDEEEFESPDFKPEDEELELFRMQLYHHHLPHLEQGGYIAWDRDADIITRGPNFEEVQPLIELISNHQDERPEDWPQSDECS